MPIEVKLNKRHPPQDTLQNAVSKRKVAGTDETLDEAFQRILRMNNSDPEKERILAVQKGIEDNRIGRERKPQENGKKLTKAEVLRLYKQLQEELREEKLQKLVESTPSNYKLIQTEDALDALIADLHAEEIIAVDTETTGVDVYTDVIVGISLTLPKQNYHVYIPVGHDEGEQLSRVYVFNALDEFMRDESLGKVLYNAVFDMHMFRRHGYALEGVVWDGMTAMHLLDENQQSFKLKDIAPKYLGVESDTFGELFGNTLFSAVPLDVALVYAAKDTDITWQLYVFQKQHMERLPTLLEYYQTVEVPLLPVLVRLESNGYHLDLDYAREYGQQLRDESEELGEYLVAELADYHDGEQPINLGSTDQMKPALSKYIGKELPNMQKDKTLKPLANKHPIIDKLLRYRKLTKLSSTYIDALPDKQNPTTKKWHSRFNPMGTVTGRFSSGKDEEDTSGQGFNSQNQPPEARPMFVPDRGKVLIGADFKAQEIRCAAYLSGERVLIDAFWNGQDPYATMASKFYKKPVDEVNKTADGKDTKERKEMKVVWLATLYGMSDFSIADTLNISKDKAKKFKQEVFGEMPTLQKWLEDNEIFARKYGFVWADKKYRKRRLPDAKKEKVQIPYGKYNKPEFEKERIHNASINRAMRQATNARVQGSSSIQMKVTMIAMDAFCQSKPGWSLWGTVHDEIILQAPENFTEAEAAEVERIMVEAYLWGDNEVPNGTDIEVMRRWGEGVDLADWFNQKEDGHHVK